MLKSTFGTVITFGDWVAFTLTATRMALASLLHPRRWLPQLDPIFFGALMLGLVTGIALGAVVWMHTYGILKRNGTQDLLPTALAAAILLELAPIGAGLITAARTGAGLAAELGAMKINEQIDAMELLGAPRMRYLVGPRVLAAMVALPLLHVFIAATALGSGYVMSALIDHSSWIKYEEACLRELHLFDVVAAALKTIVFGLLIGVTGCYSGLLAEGGTEGVGHAATRGVVYSILLVLIADVFLVGLIQVYKGGG